MAGARSPSPKQREKLALIAAPVTVAMPGGLTIKWHRPRRTGVQPPRPARGRPCYGILSNTGRRGFGAGLFGFVDANAGRPRSPALRCQVASSPPPPGGCHPLLRWRTAPACNGHLGGCYSCPLTGSNLPSCALVRRHQEVSGSLALCVARIPSGLSTASTVTGYPSIFPSFLHAGAKFSQAPLPDHPVSFAKAGTGIAIVLVQY